VQAVYCRLFWDDADNSPSKTIYLLSNTSICWDITPCSPLKVIQRFGGKCHLYLKGRRIQKALFSTYITLVSSLAYSSTPKTDVICSSETSVDFQRIIWNYIHKMKLFITTAVRISNPNLPITVFKNTAAGTTSIKLCKFGNSTPKQNANILWWIWYTGTRSSRVIRTVQVWNVWPLVFIYSPTMIRHPRGQFTPCLNCREGVGTLQGFSVMAFPGKSWSLLWNYKLIFWTWFYVPNLHCWLSCCYIDTHSG
jgi:hypothetical protein